MVIHQHSRKLLKMDILMSETCWAHNEWNKIASDIKLVFHLSTKAEWCWALCLTLSTGCSCVVFLCSLQILLLCECRWHTLNCYLFQGREEDQTLQDKTRRPTVRDWISSVWEPGGISQLLQASSPLSQSEALLSRDRRFCQRDGSGEFLTFVRCGSV